MNGKDCLLAFADLGDPYIAAASDTETIRREFLRQKKRRRRMLGAVCGCLAVVLAVAAVNIGSRSRRTAVVPPPDTGASDRLLTEPSSAAAPGTVPGFVPPDAQTPQNSAEQVSDAEQIQTASAPNGTRDPEPSAGVSPAFEAVTEPPERAFERSYRYALNDPSYSSYVPGRVIPPDRVGEKIADAAVTAGWKYADGTMPETERLRCEIYRIADVDPATAICIRFLDQGEALTTDHYYVQLNTLADLSAVSDYVISEYAANGEE